MLVLLYHGSRTNETDPSFKNISREFEYESHYFEVGHRPKTDIREHEIASPTSGIPNIGFMLVLVDHGSSTNERDPSIV
jgi:hypothetical protein